MRYIFKTLFLFTLIIVFVSCSSADKNRNNLKNNIVNKVNIGQKTTGEKKEMPPERDNNSQHTTKIPLSKELKNEIIPRDDIIEAKSVLTKRMPLSKVPAGYRDSFNDCMKDVEDKDPSDLESISLKDEYLGEFADKYSTTIHGAQDIKMICRAVKNTDLNICNRFQKYSYAGICESSILFFNIAKMLKERTKTEDEVVNEIKRLGFLDPSRMKEGVRVTEQDVKDFYAILAKNKKIDLFDKCNKVGLTDRTQCIAKIVAPFKADPDACNILPEDTPLSTVKFCKAFAYFMKAAKNNDPSICGKIEDHLTKMLCLSALGQDNINCNKIDINIKKLYCMHKVISDRRKKDEKAKEGHKEGK